MPDDFYQPIIAALFGTVTHALFPAPWRRDGDKEILAAAGMATLEIVSRLNQSDVDNATLDALRITTDRLASEYPFMPSDQLLIEGRSGCAASSNSTPRTSRSRSTVRFLNCPGGSRCRSAVSCTTRATVTLLNRRGKLRSRSPPRLTMRKSPGGRTRCGLGSPSRPGTTAESSRQRGPERQVRPDRR